VGIWYRIDRSQFVVKYVSQEIISIVSSICDILFIPVSPILAFLGQERICVGKYIFPFRVSQEIINAVGRDIFN
jgi:hypothetical protein